MALKHLALLSLIIPLCASCEEMLITFSSRAYAGGFDQVWQSVRPVMDQTGNLMDARQVVVELLDSDSGKKTGLTLRLIPPQKNKEIVSFQDGSQNQERLFKRNRFSWFDPKVEAQRETFSLHPDSGAWELELSGLNREDSLQIDWVFVRHKDGERLLTLTGPEGKVILKKANTGEDGRGIYHTSGPHRGTEKIRFRLEPAGKGWPCLPNSIRIVRR